jgi:hypothetical protein
VGSFPVLKKAKVAAVGREEGQRYQRWGTLPCTEEGQRARDGDGRKVSVTRDGDGRRPAVPEVGNSLCRGRPAYQRWGLRKARLAVVGKLPVLKKASVPVVGKVQ